METGREDECSCMLVRRWLKVHASTSPNKYCESDGKALGYRGTVCGMRWEHNCFPPNVLSPFSFPVLIQMIHRRLEFGEKKNGN